MLQLRTKIVANVVTMEAKTANDIVLRASTLSQVVSQGAETTTEMRVSIKQ